MVGAVEPWIGEGTFPVPNGAITSRYGESRSYGPHKGIDIAGKLGTTVVAIFAGQVSAIYPNGELDGYGITVLVQHSPNLWSLYAHLAATPLVKGQLVSSGERIGALGGTAGNGINRDAVVTPHLHFELLNQWPPDGRTSNRLNPNLLLSTLANQKSATQPHLSAMVGQTDLLPLAVMLALGVLFWRYRTTP